MAAGAGPPAPRPASGAPAPPSRARKILVRTLVGGGLTLALVLALWAVHASGRGTWILGIAMTLAVAGLWELDRMGALAGRGLGPVAMVAWLGPAWLWWHRADVARLPPGPPPLPAWLLQDVLVAGAVASLTWPAARIARGSRAFALPAAVAGAVWTVVPLPGLFGVWLAYGVAGVAALLVLSKIGDVAGYYVGSAIGRTRPFPRISPGKTTAGCVGSLFAGVVAGGACVALGVLPEGRWGMVGGCLAGLVINLAAQAGDLFESWVKRRAGVKDSGTWFGPSGGVLDLVDSLLFSVPAALLVWPFLFPGGWGPSTLSPG